MLKPYIAEAMGVAVKHTYTVEARKGGRRAALVRMTGVYLWGRAIHDEKGRGAMDACLWIVRECAFEL